MSFHLRPFFDDERKKMKWRILIGRIFNQWFLGKKYVNIKWKFLSLLFAQEDRDKLKSAKLHETLKPLNLRPEVEIDHILHILD